MRESQHHIRNGITTFQLSLRQLGATERQDVIGTQTVGLLTESILKNLVAREEILRRATITERDLRDAFRR